MLTMCRFIAHCNLVCRCGSEVEAGDFLGQRQFGNGHQEPDLARLLLGDLGGQQVSDDPWCRALALNRVGDDIVMAMAHNGELRLGNGRDSGAKLPRYSPLFERRPLTKAVIPEPAEHDRTWADSGRA